MFGFLSICGLHAWSRQRSTGGKDTAEVGGERFVAV